MLAYFDIIVFAAIFGFCAYRLWSVVGRPGDEASMPEHSPPPQPSATPRPTYRPVRLASPLEKETEKKFPALVKIRRIDRQFSLDQFLDGAENAFEYIIAAFVKGDIPLLESLLGPSIFKDFSSDIERRKRQNHTLERSIIRIAPIKIVEIELQRKKARITLLYESEQITCVKDSDGKIIAGDANASTTAQDLWSFEKNLASEDLNWLLSSAHTPH